MNKLTFDYIAPDGSHHTKAFSLRSDKRPNYRVKLSYQDEHGRFRQKDIDTGIKVQKSYYQEAVREGRNRAREWYEQYLLEQKQRLLAIQYKGDLTIPDYCDYYLFLLKEHGLKNNTIISYAQNLVRARKYLSNISIKDIDRRIIDGYVESLVAENNSLLRARAAGDLSVKDFSNSIKKQVNALITMCKFAYARDDNSHSDSTHISKASLDLMAKFYHKPELIPPSIEELNTILAYIKGTPLEIAVNLAAKAGLRREEVLGLKWSNVFLDNECPTIRIDSTVVRVGKQAEERNTTKSRKSLRTIPVMMDLGEYLRQLMQRQATDKELLGTGYMDSPYVFRFADGSRPQPGWITYTFKHKQEACGIHGYRFHDLRHFAATYIIKRSGDIKLAQEMLGHEQITTTMDTYAKYTTQDMIDKVKAYHL